MEQWTWIGSGTTRDAFVNNDMTRVRKVAKNERGIEANRKEVLFSEKLENPYIPKGVVMIDDATIERDYYLPYPDDMPLPIPRDDMALRSLMFEHNIHDIFAYKPNWGLTRDGKPILIDFGMGNL